ncbi:DUF6895 family protein [Streptomyces cyaneofuscatus]|uniref:DUF6895 family protein n=1 Tax=Streptomyces cyaneofuscatus TaxID=66883 RepID=UPI00341C2C24
MSSPLDQLSAGALDWLGDHLDHFDPFSGSAPSATHAPAKAALELALLCHCAARLDRPPDSLGGATALVRTLWQHPGLPPLLDAHPGHAPSYRLIYAALAPDGIDDTYRRATLARLPAGFLSPDGKSPYQRIEIRYYADKAGVRHGIEPYAELAPHSPLVAFRPPAPESAPGNVPGEVPGDEAGGVPGDAAVNGTAPLTAPQAYALTHAGFYLGDFGRARPALAGGALAHARDLVDRMLTHCVEHDRWDLAAELVLTQFILGLDPLRTLSGAAAVECLAHAQRPDGAIPGRSAALAATGAPTGGKFFRLAYHTTLVTALMALTVSAAGRPS